MEYVAPASGSYQSNTLMGPEAGAAAFRADDIADNPAAPAFAGATGLLGGIARHARPKAACELVDHATVTLEGGIAGDYRGAMKGKPYRRQVTLIERGDWKAALAEVGADIPWQERRSNLLIDGMDLPQTKGVRLRIGADVVLEITRETDPCERMEALAAGLKTALQPDWRGGACAMVITGGNIAVGDTIRIET